MKKIIFVISLLVCTIMQAQTTTVVTKQQRQQARENFMKIPKENLMEYKTQMWKRKPDVKVSPDMIIPNKQVPVKAVNEISELPEDAIFPIESDEVQAICMTWSYFGVTLDGKQAVTPMFENKGTTSYYSTQLVDMVQIIDTFESESASSCKLFADLANGIQKHAQVWMFLAYDEDTLILKEYMEKRGTPLTNVRFFIHQTNQFWFRDFGPMAFYYGDDDQIGIVDMEYYPGRPMDDEIPIKLAEDLNWKLLKTNLAYEGGNILMDGLGSLFTSDQLYEGNQDTYGQIKMNAAGTSYNYTQRTALSQSEVDERLHKDFNLTNITVVPKLTYDGGTGHIDLYADMWEETGFVVAKYPNELSSWSDAQTVESNVNTFTSKTNYFGNNYDAVRIPLPRRDNGQWYTSPGSSSPYGSNGEGTYMHGTRCFSNHTFVNDAIIQAVFYDESATNQGDVEGNKNALNVMSYAYPGYKFEEVDVRDFDGYGGAIHCITKQIPAENPVRIYHQPVRFFNTSDNGNMYNIEVLSQNKSGIDNVKIYYKKASEGQWHHVVMSAQGDNLFKCQIELNADLDNDTLFYYISSTSNNGKTITKPMTAHNGGFYVMPYGKTVTAINKDYAYTTMNAAVVDTTNLEYEKNPVSINTVQYLQNISEIYPNPAKDNVVITLNNDKDLYYRIVNLKGQIQQNGKIDKGCVNYEINTKDLKTGHYWVVFTDGNFSTSRKLVIIK